MRRRGRWAIAQRGAGRGDDPSPAGCSCNVAPGHCEPVTDVTGVAIRFPTATQVLVSIAPAELHRTKGHFVQRGLALTGVPAEAQRSGFGGERRRKGVNGAFRPKGGNGVHGLCDDAGMSRSDKGVHFPLITHHFPYAYAISHRISGIFSRLSTGINS